MDFKSELSNSEIESNDFELEINSLLQAIDKFDSRYFIDEIKEEELLINKSYLSNLKFIFANKIPILDEKEIFQ